VFTTRLLYSAIISAPGPNRANLVSGSASLITSRKSSKVADNDLAYKVLDFLPDSSGSFYAVCREPAAVFPTDPRDGKVLQLTDDSFQKITLAGASRVSLYDKSTNVFFYREQWLFDF